MTDRKNLGEIKNRAKGALLRLPGVHGIAIGLKLQAGVLIPAMCIQVFVRRKIKQSELPPDQLIPREVYGVATDVIETDPVRSFLDPDECPGIDRDDATYRPLRGGVMIQAHGGGRGTLACIVRTRETPPRDVMLTNEHVLYSGTASGPSCTGCTDGSRVGQPGWSRTTELGNVHKSKVTPLVDCAFATLDRGTQWQAEIEGIGTINGTEHVTWEVLEEHVMSGAGLYRVRKRGATTRLTSGVISSVDFEGTADDVFGTHREHFEQQIAIYPDGYEAGGVCFSVPGDSGAAVVNDDNKIVGLLFGGTEVRIETTGVEFRSGGACPIQSVMDALQVDVVHSQPAGHTFTVPSVTAFASLPAASPAAATSVDLEDHIRLRERVQQDLRRLPRGEAYVSLFKRHEGEVRSLVNTNRKVATIWHRNYGPTLLHHLIRSAEQRDRPLPIAVAERPWRECVTRILDALQKYGSERLRADIHRARHFVTSFGGRTYTQLLNDLAERPLLDPGSRLVEDRA